MPEDEGFISVVGHLDLDHKSGKIDFVGPGSAPLASGLEHEPRIRLEVRDEQENVLKTFPAALRRPTCDGGKAPYGLVQESLPRVPGMAEVVLKVDDVVVDTFSAAQAAGTLSNLWNRATTALTHVAEVAGMVGPGTAARRSKGRNIVQVRKDDEEHWQTVATNRASTDDDVDPAQFPGAEHLTVRVLAPEGFDWKTISERRIDVAGQGAAAGGALEAGEEASHA